MTVPASLSRTARQVVGGETSCLHQGLVKLRMTPHAVAVNHLLALCDGLHCHGLAAHCKDVRVSQPILSLKEIFAERARMRDMAVVTRSHALVGAVLPSGIIGTHDVAIGADARVVRKIAISP